MEIPTLTSEKEMEMNNVLKLFAQTTGKLCKKLVKVDSPLVNQKDNSEAEKAVANKVLWTPRIVY